MAAARVKSSLDNWLNEVSDLSNDECESGAAAHWTDRRRMAPLNVIRTSDLLKGECPLFGPLRRPELSLNEPGQNLTSETLKLHEW